MTSSFNSSRGRKFLGFKMVFNKIFSDKKMFIILMMGFSSGLPLLLTASTLGVWLLEVGIDKASIGALSLVGFPYTCKFLWAPFFDQMKIPILTPLLGQRRSFLIVIQLLLSLSLAALAFSNPSIMPWLSAFFALSTAFLSASQDIVIDAFRVEMLQEQSQGTGAATYIFGYRIAMLVAGAGCFYLASFISWPLVYFSMSGLMALSMIATLFSKEPVPINTNERKNHNKITEAIWAPLKNFLSKKHWPLILLLILLYKLGDAFLTGMSNVFFLEIGFSKIEIANIVKVFGLLATLGGGFIAAAMAKKFGLLPTMLYCGIIHVVANSVFIFQAWVGYNLGLLIITIGIENITAGMTGVMLVAYISELARGKNTATHYAFLSSLVAVSRTMLSSTAGILATFMGWPAYFLFTSLVMLPALMIIAILIREERKVKTTLDPELTHS